MVEFYQQVNGLYACYSTRTQKWLISDMPRAVMEKLFAHPICIEDINPDLPSLPAAMKRTRLPSLVEFMADRGANCKRIQYRPWFSVVEFSTRGLSYEYMRGDATEVGEMVRFRHNKSATIFDPKREIVRETRDSSRTVFSKKVSDPDFPSEAELFDLFVPFLVSLAREDLVDVVLLDRKDSDLILTCSVV